MTSAESSTGALLSGPVARPASGQKPRQLVVLLHGLGADGNDLIGLSQNWAGLLPDAVFHAPDAPEPCDMTPYGRQWFSLGDRSIAELYDGAVGAAPRLNASIDSWLAAYGLTDGDLALVGFSQGCMMALHTGLRRAKSCAAILGYSGFLIAPERLAADIRSRPPCLLVHGDADTIVPSAFLGPSCDAMVSVGVSVSADIRPGLGHGIDVSGLAAGGAFLKRHLLPAA